MTKFTIEEKKRYDWKVTIKKIAITVGFSATLAAVNSLIVSLTNLELPVDSMETLYVGLGIATLRGIENYIKNKDK